MLTRRVSETGCSPSSTSALSVSDTSSAETGLWCVDSLPHDGLFRADLGLNPQSNCAALARNVPLEQVVEEIPAMRQMDMQGDASGYLTAGTAPFLTLQCVSPFPGMRR